MFWTERIRFKYPDRLPVICERDENCSLPRVPRWKYLVTEDMTVAAFLLAIRKVANFANNVILSNIVNYLCMPCFTL